MYIAGTEKSIIKVFNKILSSKPIVDKNPYGNGDASKKIRSHIESLNVENKTISIIGLGYVGLPTALIVANAGYKVFGYDKDTEMITELNNHKLRILENGFEKFFKSVVKKIR